MHRPLSGKAGELRVARFFTITAVGDQCQWPGRALSTDLGMALDGDREALSAPPPVLYAGH